MLLDIVRATDGRILEGGGFDNTPDGIFAALNRETAYGGTILRDNSCLLYTSFTVFSVNGKELSRIKKGIGRFTASLIKYSMKYMESD